MNNNITIHYDFTDGTELSYGEAVETTKNFTTNCLEFFNCDNLNAKIIKKNGSEMSVRELLRNEGAHIDKDIRTTHNLHKILVAGGFRW